MPLAGFLVMLQDQREKTRILFKYTFEFESIDGQKFLGIGADFSETGLSFFSFQPVKEGTELKFNLTFPSDGLKFSITGFVKNTLSGIKKGSSVEELFALRLCHACNQVFEHTELRCPRCKSTYFEVLGDGFEAIEQNIYWIGAWKK